MSVRDCIQKIKQKTKTRRQRWAVHFVSKFLGNYADIQKPQTASEGEFRLDNFLKNTVKPAPWCGFFVCEISVKKIDRGKNTQYNC